MLILALFTTCGGVKNKIYCCICPHFHSLLGVDTLCIGVLEAKYWTYDKIGAWMWVAAMFHMSMECINGVTNGNLNPTIAIEKFLENLMGLTLAVYL